MCMCVLILCVVFIFPIVVIHTQFRRGTKTTKPRFHTHTNTQDVWQKKISENATSVVRDGVCNTCARSGKLGWKR